jgi:hypothetical protein
MLLISLVLLHEAKDEVLEELLSRPLPEGLCPRMPGFFDTLPDLLVYGHFLVGTKKLVLECLHILHEVFIARALIS